MSTRCLEADFAADELFKASIGNDRTRRACAD
jgi:hypothetical protein